MKRDRPLTPTENAEIARLEEEIACLKASIRALQDKIADPRTVIDADHPTLLLVHPVMDFVAKEIADLKAQVQTIDAQVTDLECQESLNRQIVRALEMSVQKTADASGQRHVDVQDAIENYDDQQYYEYLESREAIATGSGQVPVSDPHLGL